MSDSNVWESSSNWRRGPSNDTPARPAQAGRPGSWRGGNGDSKPAQRQPIKRWAERPRGEDVTVHRPERQRDEPETEKAIAEGRRIYVGNLLYRATPEDIEQLLADNGLAPAEKIHMSVDSFSNRNPGYCFIEFVDQETAEAAMTTLEGKLLLDRPVKSRPCQPKGDRRRDGREPSQSKDYGANRWGDWGRKGDADADAQGNRVDAAVQDRIVKEGRQLYVGGLPRMLDQAMNDEEMRDLFKDFEVESVSKRVSPDERKRTLPGRHNFCFVNFSTADQAALALAKINGADYRGDQLRVSYAKGNSQARERQKYQAPA